MANLVMREKDVKGEVVLTALGGEKEAKVEAIFNTGSSYNIISKELAEKLDCFIPHSEKLELKTAEEGGKLRIVGFCPVKVEFEGVKVYELFLVAENLAKETELILGRPALDHLDIVFTPKGPKPGKEAGKLVVL